MRSVPEFFQTFGALVGFAVGCITVYDRLLRYRPHVSIYAYLEGVNPWPMLRVTNTAPFDIFIEIGIDPPLITVTQQTTVRAIADTLIGARVTATIAPEKSADFHIIGRGTDNEGREADRDPNQV